MTASSAFIVVACAQAQECLEHASSYFNQGLSRLLSAKGVANSVQPNRGVCFANRDESKVKAAERELERYFYEVADTLRNSCDEASVVAWATRERLPFEVHDTTDSGDRPSYRMISIYSFSPEEVISNRRKLAEAPRVQQCAAKS